MNFTILTEESNLKINIKHMERIKKFSLLNLLKTGGIVSKTSYNNMVQFSRDSL